MEKIVTLMTIEKVQTMTDGAIRVTLDMNETAIMQMAQLVECKRIGIVLKAEFTPMTEDKQEEKHSGESWKPLG